MNKELILKLVGITAIFVLISIIFNKCTRSIVNSMNEEIETTTIETTTEESTYEYNLVEKSRNFGVDTKIDRDKYFEYLINNIENDKIKEYIYQRDFYDEYSGMNGSTILKLLTSNAYRNFFEAIFNKNVNDFSNCPVTEKFIKKYKQNLVEYFNIKGEEFWVSTETDKQIIKVEARSGISLDGEAEYSMLYRFKYTLDEDGNVDDVILEHIGWD